MEPKQHLYLVDGSAYIFRAYHRLPPLTNPEGTPVGAVYGYTTMLWKLADDLHKADGPTHLAVVLDKSSVSFRNDLYDQYKANRPPPPEDLVPQFPLIRDATRAFSLPCIEEPGVEGVRPPLELGERPCVRGDGVLQELQERAAQGAGSGEVAHRAAGEGQVQPRRRVEHVPPQRRAVLVRVASPWPWRWPECSG